MGRAGRFRVPGYGKVCWEDARPGPWGGPSRRVMGLGKREEIALELQGSSEMDLPTLPGHRFSASKMRRAQSPVSISCLGCISASAGAGLGAHRLTPSQGAFLRMMEWLRVLYTGIRKTPSCPPGCSWDAREGREWCDPVAGVPRSRDRGWRSVGSFRKLMGKFWGNARRD